jgi:ATP-dependent RNA helicase MSS116, mitochondrial
MAFVTAVALRGCRLTAQSRRLCARPLRAAVADALARRLHASPTAATAGDSPARRRVASSPTASSASATAVAAAAATATRTSSTTRAELTETKFADMRLSAPLQRSLREVFAYETTTAVQAAAVPLALDGRDILVKAKTGTGKTIAFVLPALERVLAGGAAGAGAGVQLLVLSPTRELALQIAEEAAMLCRFAPAITVQAVVGGTNVRTDVARFGRGMPTVLIATPGRLIDHLGTPSSGIARGLAGMQTLVLDEADRLLDMGFRPSIEQILGYLPGVADRQTLLFSATMPADVREMTRLALKPAHDVVDCVGKEVSTHGLVQQTVVVTPLDEQIAALKCVLAEMMAVDKYKILVFFGTARQTQMYAELWNKMDAARPVLEIHSRKTQASRNRTADTFRRNHSLIMFSSDVTARGLDFPDVTGVVSFGRPTDREQYIHRLGRTARGSGAVGKGVLVLADFEAHGFTKMLADLPVKPAAPFPAALLEDSMRQVRAAFATIAPQSKSQAYQSTLAFYGQYLKSMGRGWDKERLVEVLNDWVVNVCMSEEVPALRAATVGKVRRRVRGRSWARRAIARSAPRRR